MIVRSNEQLISAPTEAILESISDGVFTIDMDWRVTSFNKAAETITGIPRTEAIGRTCSDVFHSSMCTGDCALRATLKSGRPIIGKSCYIVNIEGDRVPISVSTAVLRDANGKILGGAETFRDISEIEHLKQELQGRSKVGNLTSRNPRMQNVIEVLPKIAASPSTVLIQGKVGTGKELVARTIHELSLRRNGPFVTLNCAVLSDNILESELFGIDQGAAGSKPGYFAQAQGGTLFLAEISEIGVSLQVKLLRVLQDKTYAKIGSSHSESVDFLVIFATNKNISPLVGTGLFREDLYYHINVMHLKILSLKERKEDIPLLIEEFIEHFSRLHKKSIESIDFEALTLLMAHDWPGNISELENVIERCFIMCAGPIINIHHLPVEFIDNDRLRSAASHIKKARQNINLHFILEALERHNYNRQAAADELGIHKTTFFRLVRKLKISLPKKDGRSHSPLTRSEGLIE